MLPSARWLCRDQQCQSHLATATAWCVSAHSLKPAVHQLKSRSASSSSLELDRISVQDRACCYRLEHHVDLQVDNDFDFADFVIDFLTEEFSKIVKLEFLMWAIAIIWIAFPDDSYAGFWMTGLFMLASITAGALCMCQSCACAFCAMHQPRSQPTPLAPTYPQALLISLIVRLCPRSRRRATSTPTRCNANAE